MMQFWRKWLSSPKHGLARGVAVYGSPGFRSDEARLTALLSDCRQLRIWAREHDVALDDTSDSLAALDWALARSDEQVRQALAQDCGRYLGTVIVRHQPRARWQVWPSGHPVVRLASGRDLDVVARARGEARNGKPSLAGLYAEAAQG
jgi:hypothetical protein